MLSRVRTYVRTSNERTNERSFVRSFVVRSFVRPSVCSFRAFVSCSKKILALKKLGAKKFGVEQFWRKTILAYQQDQQDHPADPADPAEQRQVCFSLTAKNKNQAVRTVLTQT